MIIRKMFGKEIFDALLVSNQTEIEKLVAASHEHKLLVFRNQHHITPQDQVQIARCFGEIDSAPYHKHPKSPCDEIFRVSNDETEGCRGVGRTGWHIDGSFRPRPYSHSLYHMIAVPSSGDTRFVDLEAVLDSLPRETLDRWNRLSMLSDRQSCVTHPLVYRHPVTRRSTMCFHCGMTEAFLYDYGEKDERVCSKNETRQILNEITAEILKDNEKHVYSHKWNVGDFIISDNLAVGHEADPDSQTPRAKVGLRVLHRVTVAGRHELSK